jgi:phage shock protein PspC (stress-responsive transcriptional regulator)
MSTSQSQIDTGVIVRRSLFFLVLITLTLANLFIFFRGLNAPAAMDQAQIAREISRGNGITTKFIRPIAYEQAKEKQKGMAVPFTGFQDTYHSPLNPLLLAAVFKVIGADDPEGWQMGENEMVFPLDRVVATVCTLFFLMAIGVNYLLISRIFDAKIAGVCAGIADYFGWELWLVRVVALASLLLGFGGFLPVLYIVGWIVLEKKSVAEARPGHLLCQRPTKDLKS